MGRWRLIGGHSLLALILAMHTGSAAGPNAASGSYLAKTGPVPLRFAPAPSGSPNQLLPPLEMVDPRTIVLTNSSPDTNSSVSLSLPPPTAVTNALTNELSAVSNAVPTVAGPAMLGPWETPTGTSAPPVQFTPQMLVDYFAPLPGVTNGWPAGVTVPAMIDFTPPILHPRSQATYESK